MEHEYDFTHKTIVVTGASAGIGYQTALEFCRRGGFVIGTGRSRQIVPEPKKRSCAVPMPGSIFCWRIYPLR
jgi:NAD(P)-dependent dehydrogenase (short-subunit alcohol dehydrogenase family)